MPRKANKISKGQRVWNALVKIILSLILLYIFMWLDYTYKLLWFQYAPIILALGFAVFAQVPNLLRTILGFPLAPMTEEMRRLMVPIDPNKDKKWKLVLYYIWEAIVIIVQLIVIVLLVIDAENNFFDKAIAVVCGILMGFCAYAVLTGQAYVTSTDGTQKKMWSKGVNPTAGMEYVPSVNAYRDSKGQYYNGKGTPIPTPVSSAKKKR